MKYDKIPGTSIEVSKICLGTMTWGQQNTEAEGHEQMDYALDHGVNFFDTAELYSVPGRKETQGSTERIIGSWFEKSGNRDKVILSSKIVGPSPGLLYIRNPLDFSAASIETAVNGSLARLKTDYIDIYQLHWPERKTNCFGVRSYSYKESDPWEDNFHDILIKMTALIKSGKVRHFGISNETPWGLSHFLKLAEKYDLARCVTIQNPYGLLNRTFEIGNAEICVRENVGLLAYSPMGFGLLSGKYHRKEDKSGDRLNLFNQMGRYNSAQNWDATTHYLALAKKYGMSGAEFSLAFVNQQKFVLSNIIGATTLAQLKENIGSINFTLSDEALSDIDEVQELIPNPAP